jgi:hypothetical protein
MNIFEAEKNFDELTTDIHQVQKSMMLLNYSAKFFSENKNHKLMWDEFLMANLDAHRVAAVIGVGKIYDMDEKNHSMSYLMRWLHLNRSEFTKEKLIARKVALGNTKEWAEEYAKNFLGIDGVQINQLAKIKKKLQALYDTKAKGLRDQAFAHRSRGVPPSGTEYQILEELADGALGIYNDIYNAYYNARDFSLKGRAYPESSQFGKHMMEFFASA